MEVCIDWMGWVKAPLQKANEEKDERSWRGGWLERAATAEVGSRCDLTRTEMPNQRSDAPRAAGAPALPCPLGAAPASQHTSGAWEHGDWRILRSFIWFPPRVKNKLSQEYPSFPGKYVLWTPPGRKRRKCNTQSGVESPSVEVFQNSAGWVLRNLRYLRSWPVLGQGAGPETCGGTKSCFSLRLKGYPRLKP